MQKITGDPASQIAARTFYSVLMFRRSATSVIQDHFFKELQNPLTECWVLWFQPPSKALKFLLQVLG